MTQSQTDCYIGAIVATIVFTINRLTVQLASIDLFTRLEIVALIARNMAAHFSRPLWAENSWTAALPIRQLVMAAGGAGPLINKLCLPVFCHPNVCSEDN